MKYYVAYGSNLNMEQMAYRCPDAKPLGKLMLKNRRLVFNGVATVVREEGATVPVGVWEISDDDEKNLDKYEGYPFLYRKEYLGMTIKRRDEDVKHVKAMIYVMNEGRRFPAPPSDHYYQIILDGYYDFGMDTRYLYDAAVESIEFYKK